VHTDRQVLYRALVLTVELGLIIEYLASVSKLNITNQKPRDTGRKYLNGGQRWLKSVFLKENVRYPAEVCMDWILDFLDPDSGCVRQDPGSDFLNKNRIRTGFGFCNFLMKNGL